MLAATQSERRQAHADRQTDRQMCVVPSSCLLLVERTVIAVAPQYMRVYVSRYCTYLVRTWNPDSARLIDLGPTRKGRKQRAVEAEAATFCQKERIKKGGRERSNFCQITHETPRSFCSVVLSLSCSKCNPANSWHLRGEAS